MGRIAKVPRITTSQLNKMLPVDSAIYDFAKIGEARRFAKRADAKVVALVSDRDGSLIAYLSIPKHFKV